MHKDGAHSGERHIPALTAIIFDHTDCLSLPPFVGENVLNASDISYVRFTPERQLIPYIFT